jgi:hypothetical protein
MSGICLSDGEVEELYIALKPREAALPDPLISLLTRLERSLYQRLTVEELERLSRRFSPHG